MRLAIVLLLALPACRGATELQLVADRTTISAGGNDFATITATALVWGEPVKGGTAVSFDNSSSDTPGAFNVATGPDSLDVACDGSGVATVKLYSNSAQGSATVSASFYDDESGEQAESSITIVFGAASGAQQPVDGTFRMSCDAVNIGALRVPTPDIQVTCSLTAQSRSGQSIAGSALSPKFLTEAGSLTAQIDSYTGKQVYIYTSKGGAAAPRDVAPLASLGEKSYLDGNAKQRNPRDGLATLLAVVDGEEAFTDLNGNGKYDSGEPFVDTVEPFVDEDDDDQKGAQEKYLDSNGNGVWDKANGKWDAKTKIAAMYKLLWTGPLDSSKNTSRYASSNAGGDFTIAEGGKVEITAYVLDANMNPVAAFDKNSDYVEWTVAAGSSDASTNDNTTVTLKNVLGFSFNSTATTERKRWQITPNSIAPQSFKITVEDYYKDTTKKAYSYSVSLSGMFTPGPGADGYYVNAVSEKITGKAEGTCD